MIARCRRVAYTACRCPRAEGTIGMIEGSSRVRSRRRLPRRPSLDQAEVGADRARGGQAKRARRRIGPVRCRDVPGMDEAERMSPIAPSARPERTLVTPNPRANGLVAKIARCRLTER